MPPGRNGGHLTRNPFSSFLKRQDIFNTSEAVKSYRLEQYTSDALVQFIADRKLADSVDLVEGGHIGVFRTEEEEQVARRDYEAARAAGVGTGDLGVRWIANEELTNVRSRFHSFLLGNELNLCIIIQKYGLNPKLNYTGVYFGGHNLWPSKLVTELFLDAQKSSNGVEVVLHTHTPVTSLSKIHVFDNDILDLPISDDPNDVQVRQRWTLHTPRGGLSCSYVIHATNAYAGHLLPFLSESNDRMEAHEETISSSSPPEDKCPSHPPPHSKPGHPEHKHPPTRGLYSIIPTRGQVGAVRASVDASQLGWLHSWDGGGGGWEYWFPRYQESPGKHPLIILGGARQRSGGDLETGVTDDSELNPLVSQALREFLPEFLPGQFDTAGGNGSGGWEMEWVGEPFPWAVWYSFCFCFCAPCLSSRVLILDFFTDRNNGVYKDQDSVRTFRMSFLAESLKPKILLFRLDPLPLLQPQTTSQRNQIIMKDNTLLLDMRGTGCLALTPGMCYTFP